MTDSVVRIVDAYVYRRDGDELRFLLLKRSPDKMYAGIWQGVAGKIQSGEAAWEAAIRELREETGLTPSFMFIADHVSMFYETHGDRINLVPVFGIEVSSTDVILSEEHCDYRWATFPQAIDTLVWSGQKTGLESVYNMISANDDRLRWSEISLTTKE